MPKEDLVSDADLRMLAGEKLSPGILEPCRAVSDSGLWNIYWPRFRKRATCAIRLGERISPLKAIPDVTPRIGIEANGPEPRRTLPPMRRRSHGQRFA